MKYQRTPFKNGTPIGEPQIITLSNAEEEEVLRYYGSSSRGGLIDTYNKLSSITYPAGIKWHYELLTSEEPTK